MILDILTYPDPRLRKRSQDVRSVEEARELVENMAETMYAAPGVGLAAPQVGVSLRVAVIDVSPPDKKDLLVFINPDIISREGEAGIEEGCLSVPGPRALIRRAERLTVRALDASGKSFERTAEGLLAIAIQHEIDHLNGRLFIDHLSRLKRETLLRDYEKAGPERSSVRL